jgi:hypothetical protein
MSPFPVIPNLHPRLTQEGQVLLKSPGKPEGAACNPLVNSVLLGCMDMPGRLHTDNISRTLPLTACLYDLIGQAHNMLYSIPAECCACFDHAFA